MICVERIPAPPLAGVLSVGDLRASLLPIAVDRIRIWRRGLPDYNPLAVRLLTVPGAALRFVRSLTGAVNTAHVYCVRMEAPVADRPIKIGVTNTVGLRLGSLQSGSPYEMTLLGTFPAELLPERDLHRFFADYRMRREWFRPAPPVLLFVDLLRSLAVAGSAVAA